MHGLSDRLGVGWAREELRWRVEVARRVRGGEEGQGLVEYVLITAVLAVGALLALQALSGGITGVLTRVAGRLAAVG